MSRSGKIPIALPKGVEVKVTGMTVTVKGPKGTLSADVNEQVQVTVENGQVLVAVAELTREMSRFQGLYRSLINNMVVGATEGFEKKLEMVGVGFRATVQGNLLDLQLGFSHETKIPIPTGIAVKIEKSTLISITGIDKQLVGEFAASVRRLRKPEPFKGKGIRYVDEYVRRKAGKAGKKQ
jgi:large subunit ribosomal protein L6